jgi:hypothetical protein
MQTVERKSVEGGGMGMNLKFQPEERKTDGLMNRTEK